MTRRVLAYVVAAVMLLALAKSAGAEPRALRVALAGFEEDNFDPKFTGGTTIMRISVPIYDYLTWLSPSFQVVPGLAERWETSADGRTYTFHLRRGAKFHNGDPVTAQDVQFSLSRQMDKDSKNTSAGTFRGMLESIDVPDSSTVVMRLKAPDPDLLLNLSPYVGGSPVLPSAYMTKVGVDAFSRAPVGSGPWKLIRHEPGSRIEYQAVPGHWRAQPGFDRLILLAVPEESTRIAMLERGEADIAEVSVERDAELRARGVKLTNIPRVMQFGVFFYGSWVNPRGPMADLRVRRALAQAVDYDAIIKGILLGQGERSLPWGIFPGASYADPSRPSQRPITRDLGKARELLREAGYTGGFDLRLHSMQFSGAPFLPRVAEVVASNWKEIGVNVQLVPVDFGAFRAMYRGRDPRLNGTATIFRYPAVFDAAFNCQDRGVIRTNGSQPLHNSKKVDELCEDAVKESDPKLRAEKMRKVFDFLNEEPLVGFTIAYANALYATNPRAVGDWTPITSFIDLGPVYERMQPAR